MINRRRYGSTAHVMHQRQDSHNFRNVCQKACASLLVKFTNLDYLKCQPLAASRALSIVDTLSGLKEGVLLYSITTVRSKHAIKYLLRVPCKEIARNMVEFHDAIEFATELMDKKINTWAECQADNKRKSDDTARNNQNQQPNKRQNTRRAYAAGNGDRRPYGGPRPLNPLNVNTRANQRVCFECGAQGHFKRDCPKLKNNNSQGNRVGNANASGKKKGCNAMGNQGQTGQQCRHGLATRIVITPTALES
ncbi:putative reverse transcriptase domain-containing protein [Tanacetum coccineum]